ncbi:hypothetical protein, partial [Glycomyces tenuis]
AVAAAVPTDGAPARSDPAPGSVEQAITDPNPDHIRVALANPGMTVEILGEPEPLDTGALTGEVNLARPEGDQAMTTSALVLASSGAVGDLGQVFGAVRPGPLADFRYDTSTQSIIFNPGVEIEAESVPGIDKPGGPVFLYTGPMRMLPTEPVANPQFPPYGQTFYAPGPVVLWEGESGVTGAEPVGLLTGFRLTVTHPG